MSTLVIGLLLNCVAVDRETAADSRLFSTSTLSIVTKIVTVLAA